MLTINIWDLLWTIVNFFLLYLVLTKLLYKPIVRFMDQRNARIQAGLAAQQAARETVAAREAALRAEKDQCRREAARLMDEAAAARARQRGDVSARLRQESLRLREEMRQEVRQRQELDAGRLAEQETELAALLAERLLNTSGQSA